MQIQAIWSAIPEREREKPLYDQDEHLPIRERREEETHAHMHTGHGSIFSVPWPVQHTYTHVRQRERERGDTVRTANIHLSYCRGDSPAETAAADNYSTT